MTGSTAIKFSSKQSIGESDSDDLSLNENSWHHIVLTKSSSNKIKIYTNNSLSETLQLNDWSIEWLRVGTNRNTANFWKGNIDDIRIYDYVLNTDNINRRALCYDLVYSPEITPFIQSAKNNNIETIGGLAMLVFQAIKGFELVTKQKAPIKKMLEAVGIKK